MSSQIPRSFINDLLTRVDIVEIINPRVTLRKAGSNYQALCPFHNEKTPSFVVNQLKQFYHCFGCGAYGNAISFLMDFEKLTFVETIENLAAHVGIEIPRDKSFEQSGAQQKYTELYAQLEKVNNYYQQQLTKAPVALHYLQKRGIEQTTIKQYQIGYAPAVWEQFNQLLYHHPEVQQQLLLTGMLKQKTGHRDPYASFRNRIMFPIRNRRGHIIGFGGRTLGDDLPKYLNSPETPLFHKGSELYGLYEAKQNNRSLKYLIVVEGYMDVVALAQYGITNAVATLGTAITTRQVQYLLQNSSKIVFCFDGDNAGRAAAWRALENTLPAMREGIEIRFLFLPQNEDPDSIIRKEGKAAFIQRLATTLPISDFLFQRLTSTIKVNTLDGRAHLIQETKKLLQRMSHGVFKQLLFTKLAEITKTDIKTILDFGHDPAFGSKSPPSAYNSEISNNLSRRSNNSGPAFALNPIEMAIGLLLNYPELVESIANEHITMITNLNTLEASLLLNLCEILKNSTANQQQNLTLGAILEYWRDQPELPIITKIAAWEPVISHTALKNEFNGIIQKICIQSVESTVQALLQKANSIELTVEEKVTLQNLIKITKNH